MIKPDLRVTIAWGTGDQFHLAKAIKDKLDTMRKQGYPVNAQMVYSTGNGIPIAQRVKDIFLNFDYAIFLYGIKSIDVTPRGDEMVLIPENANLRELTEKMIENKAVISPKFSQNIIYELGMAMSSHEEQDIMWFFSGGNVRQSYFPTDITPPAVYSLDECSTMGLKIDYILTELHSKVRETFNYLGASYEDKITPILLNENYRPNLANLISKRSNYININSLYSYNSPMDEYFENEYAVFSQEKMEYNLDSRIQYFIDRAVLFVYLRNHKLWVRSVGQLSDAVESLLDKKSSYYFAAKLCIDVLSNVMLYHKMITDQDTSPNILFEKFDEFSKDRMLKNSMLRCLCFDYKGLCAHKKALAYLAAAIEKELFIATSEEDINAIINSDKIEQTNQAKDFFQTAIKSFDEVLRISKENAMNTAYLWEGFALYNKARCEYLLNIISPDSAKWETDMNEAIRIRKSYVETYANITPFPAVIYHNLEAEYYLAKLEQYFYNMNKMVSPNISDFRKIKESICEWKNKSSFYTDVLSVENKLSSLEALISDAHS